MERSQIEEDEALRRFREDWKREIERRKEQNDPTTASTSNGANTSQPSPATSPTTPNAPRILPYHASARQSALELYEQAVRLEESGLLEDATVLYRKSFRLDSNVDKAYHRMTMERELNGIIQDVGAISIAKPGARPNTSDSKGKNSITLSNISTLKSVLDSFPPLHSLSFDAEDETEPIYINLLPDEIVVCILREFNSTADTRSIERFASVSRRARVLTLDPSIWRELVQLVYVPPQISYPSEDLVNHYQGDYRRIYVEHPRVRMDGVYIAVCHYIRTGHSESAWVNITHLITYHRYLRFMPDGIVLSFLCSDATMTPSQVIPLLKLDGSRMKGLHVGQWYMKESALYESSEPELVIEGLLEASGTSVGPVINPLTVGNVDAKYSFRMQLALKSRPLGRWNKLDFIDYESVNNSTGEAVPLPLKHERPFWFSKVRSYGSGYSI